MTLVLALLLQFLPGLPDPDATVTVGGVVEGPYIFREDEGQTTKVVLANGMTAIVRESNASALTSLTLDVRVGYLDEPERSGLSRIVAASFARSPLHVQRLAEIGGVVEFEVEGSRTEFQTLVLPENAVRAMEIQQAALADPRVDASSTPGTIDALEIEQLSWMEDPEAFVLEHLLGVAYGDHPIGRGRRFDPALARGLEPSRPAAFFAEHYIPENMTLVVIGPFVREIMLGEIVRTFGQLAADAQAPTPTEASTGPEISDDADGGDDTTETGADTPGEGDLPPVLVATPADGNAIGPLAAPPTAGQASGDDARNLPVPIPTEFRYDWQRGRLARAHVAIGFRVPEASVAGTHERHVLETLLALLAGGRASRFQAFVRDEQGAIDQSRASLLELGSAGNPELLAFITLAAIDADRAEVAVFTELERIRRFGVGSEEVARARVRAAQGHYERRETVEGLGAGLALREFHGDWKSGERLPSGVSGVTPDEVQEFVRANLRVDNLAVFELLPGNSTRAFGTEDFLSGILGQVPDQMVARSVDELDVTVEVPVRQDALVVDVAHPMNRFGIRRGPDVYVVEDHRAPLVSFGIFFPGGRVLESSENAGITELMLESSLRGTRRFNAAEIARRIGNAGARIDIVNEPDYFGYVLEGVSGDFASALDVLMDVWQEPSFLEEDVAAARRVQFGRMLASVEQPADRALARLRSAVFAGDPYSLPRNGLPTSLESIDSDALAEWHFEHARAVLPVIAVAGDVNGSGIVSSVAATITNEDLLDRDITALPRPESLEIEPESNSDVAAPVAVLAYGGAGGPFAGPDRIPLLLAGSLVKDRIAQLPDALGGTEGGILVEVGAQFMARAGISYVLVNFVPEDDDAGSTMGAALDTQFGHLATVGPDRAELEVVAVRADLSHRRLIESRRGRVDEIARAILLGGGAEAIDGFGDAVRSFGPSAVQDAVVRFLSEGGGLQFIEVR